MITTTLNRIREHSPCHEGWLKLLRHLGKTKADDEPIPYSVIVESNGLDDALWCCRAEPQHAREWRLFAVRCARRVQHLMTDPRSIAALDVAERHASGDATDAELYAAWSAATEADRDVSWSTAYSTAREAACFVARKAACYVARCAAWSAVRDAAWSAAWSAATAEITADFLSVVGDHRGAK